MDTLRLFHIADVHLGYTGPSGLVFRADESHAGRFVREIDIEQSLRWIVRQVRAAQPPVDAILVAGDLFHRSVPLPRTVAIAARFVHELLKCGCEVVIIDGNHEVASATDTGSPTSFLRELGAHVVNWNTYDIIRDGAWRNQRLQGRLAIHTLAYPAVQAGDFSGVAPLHGCLNVLLAHGRVQGMDELNTLHRTAAWIPTHVVRRGWDYVALGDWHAHRVQPLADAPAYYAGSLTALTYGEAAFFPPRRDDLYSIRGILDISLKNGHSATVATISYGEGRPVLRLAPIDAKDMDAPALMQVIHDRFRDDLPKEALVTLKITNCTAQVRDELDFSAIEQLRQRVRRCDIHWELLHVSVGQSAEAPSEASLTDQWDAFLERQLPDPDERSWLLTEGRVRIEAARLALRAHQAEVGKE